MMVAAELDGLGRKVKLGSHQCRGPGRSEVIVPSWTHAKTPSTETLAYIWKNKIQKVALFEWLKFHCCYPGTSRCSRLGPEKKQAATSGSNGRTSASNLLASEASLYQPYALQHVRQNHQHSALHQIYEISVPSSNMRPALWFRRRFQSLWVNTLKLSQSFQPP